MKTRFFALMLMLASVVAVQAQSLTGKVWVSSLVDPDDDEITLVMGFLDGGKCIMSIISGEDIDEDGMKMEMKMNLTMQGTYTLDGKILNTDFDVSNAELDLDVDFPGLDESTKKMAKSMIASELNKQKADIKTEILKALPNFVQMTIKELTESTLILSDSTGKDQVFKVMAEK